MSEEAEQSKTKPMKRWIADYRVESSLVPEAGSAKLTFSHPAGAYDVHISTATTTNDRRDGNLAVQLIFHAPDLESAAEFADDAIRKFLHLLSFVTCTDYRVARLLHVMDWSRGITQREALIYAKRFTDDEPKPLLNQGFLASIGQLQRWGMNPLLEGSLRWFANGVAADLMEDQFQYFWFVLEGIGVATRSAERVTDKCPRCGGPLRCDDCHEVSTHRPFEKQAIEALLTRIKVAPNLIRYFFSVRNMLLHGEHKEAIEESIRAEEPKFTFHKIVDFLGQAARSAIFATFEKSGGPTEMLLGQIETFVSWHVTASAHVVLGVGGNPEEPRIEDVHLPQISFGPVDTAGHR